MNWKMLSPCTAVRSYQNDFNLTPQQSADCIFFSYQNCIFGSNTFVYKVFITLAKIQFLFCPVSIWYIDCPFPSQMLLDLLSSFSTLCFALDSSICSFCLEKVHKLHKWITASWSMSISYIDLFSTDFDPKALPCLLSVISNWAKQQENAQMEYLDVG